MDDSNLNKTAISATLHCLTGCAIGEILGLVIGEILGLSAGLTIAIAVGLAFIFGYALSLLPLFKIGLTFAAAMPIVLAADTLSITVMEVVDNGIMAIIPGAMEAGIVNPVFWLSLAFALSVAFLAAYPVNRYLLRKGKGHALVHEYHHKQHNHDGHGSALDTKVLLIGIISFIAGALLVSVAADTFEKSESEAHSTNKNQKM